MDYSLIENKGQLIIRGYVFADLIKTLKQNDELNENVLGTIQVFKKPKPNFIYSRIIIEELD